MIILTTKGPQEVEATEVAPGLFVSRWYPVEPERDEWTVSVKPGYRLTMMPLSLNDAEKLARALATLGNWDREFDQENFQGSGTTAGISNVEVRRLCFEAQKKEREIRMENMNISTRMPDTSPGPSPDREARKSFHNLGLTMTRLDPDCVMLLDESTGRTWTFQAFIPRPRCICYEVGEALCPSCRQDMHRPMPYLTILMGSGEEENIRKEATK